MAEVVANGVRLHVQRLPAAAARHRASPTVVFVHGLVMDNLSSFYYTLANPVARSGADVILYDMRGHGLSERPATGYTAADGADDLCGLLDALGVEHPVVLVGNSYGGVIATHAALRHPRRVAGLVLVEAHAGGDPARGWLEEMANTLTVAALGLEYDRVHDELRAVRRRKIARMAAAADALLNHTTLIDDLTGPRPLGAAELARISCPVLGIYGEHSDLVPAAALLAANVPDCAVEILPGLAHTVLREATGAVLEAMLPWLSERGTAPRTASERAG